MNAISTTADRVLSNAQNRRVLSAAVFLLGLLGAAAMAWSIATGDYRGGSKVVGGFLVAVWALFILRDWRMGVPSFFVWLNFEDFIRKYMGNDLTLYVVKDIIIVAAYAGYFFRYRLHNKGEIGKSLTTPLLIWFVWALAEAANPHISIVLIPILGFRMSFFYIPMLYLGYAYFKSEREFRRFFILILGLAAVVSVLGIVQSIVGLSFLNPSAAPFLRLDLVRGGAGALEVPRPSSVFVDSGRFAHYLFTMTFLGIGFLGYLYARRWPGDKKIRMFTWVCWISVLAGLYICGVRAPIVWTIMAAPIVLLAYLYVRGALDKRMKSLPISKIVFAGAVGFLILGVAFPERFTAAYKFYSSTLNPTSAHSDVESRPVTALDEMQTALESSPIFGHGTGTASLGLQYIYGKFVKTENVGSFYHVETGFAAVVWEWGLIGLAIWLWWTIVLVYKLIQGSISLRRTPFYWPAVAAGLYAFFLLFAWFSLGMQIYQDFIPQAYLFFLTGFIIRAASLARADQQYRRAGRT